MASVVIVGAGVTGSALALKLKEMGVPARVVEKSRGAGGRMATHRQRQGGRDTPVIGRADLGAQYITTRLPPDHSVMGPVYQALIEAGVLKLFEGKVEGPNPYGGAGPEIRHFSAPGGLQSVSEYFLAGSGVEISWDAFVSEIEVGETGISMRLAKGTDGTDLPGIGNMEAGTPQQIVVLTQPVPQVLGKSAKFSMGGNFLRSLSEDTTAALGKVEYSSRFAAAYFFEASTFTWPHAWTVQYYGQGDVRYLAHDSGRRGVSDEPLVSVLVHSGVPLGIEFKDEAAPFAGAAARLQADLAQKMPEVPWEKALAVKVHKWGYSQVYKGLGAQRPSADWVWDAGSNGFPGVVELFKTDRALGLLAGDAVAPASNFEGCMFSAQKTAEAIKAYLDGLAAK